MKFYYFPLYGRGEAIRMALWKAGVAYEDVRVSSEWGSLKQSGKFEFGQMPGLELDDGHVLSQSNSILEYVGATYNMKGPNPRAVHRGHSIDEFVVSDFQFKIYLKAFYAPQNQVQALLAEAFAKVPEIFDKLESILPDTKFLTGDSLSIYDFTVGGFFCNIVVNPNHQVAPQWV